MKSRSIYSVLVFIFIGGCSKFQPSYDEIDSIQSEWLLPIAKTTLSFQNIEEISEVGFDIYLSPSDLGYSAGPNFNVPPFTVAMLGPYVRPLSELIKEIKYDSLQFEVELNNGFPFALSAGTSIVYRNTMSTSSDNNILFRWTLDSECPAGELIRSTQIVSNNYLNNAIYVFIENLSSSGGNNLQFSGLPINVNSELDVIDMEYVDLFTNKSLTSVDTLSISIEEPNDTFGRATGGKATVFFENQLPIDQRFQAYFLNNGVVIDSLFASPAIIAGCSVDFTGEPTSLQSSLAIAPLSWQEWTKLAQSDKLVIHHFMSTKAYNGEYVRANNQSQLQLQLVVDVLLNVNISEL